MGETAELVLMCAYLDGARDGWETALKVLAESLQRELGTGAPDRGVVETNLLRIRAERWAKEFVKTYG